MKVGFVMDPLNQIKAYKDSTVAMIEAALKRGFQVFAMQTNELFIEQAKAFSSMQEILSVDIKSSPWYQLGSSSTQELASLDVILMRKDPPFDMDYIYATYILELAERAGARVINKPQSLRDANEKCFITQFPECIADTLVSADPIRIKQFLEQQQDIIVKPLDGMGGASIFRLTEADHNINVILETMTQFGRRHIMAQRYLPEVKLGDKRILLINGEPVPFALARIPQGKETRANMAAGGKPKAQPLSDRDKWLCEQVGPVLKQKGLYFVGIDVIGDYITEINVTSPTGIKELNEQCNLDIAGDLIDFIDRKL
ncbi:MAG: glutathione synthase [Gammaproteobacteria bacterium]|jgi:glutathione synthase|nr:glutathione synthase [Gammaproteobacteria bacterium]